MAVGDFNSDGKLDLAVANFGSSNVGVLLNNGAGGFAAAVPFTFGSSPDLVAVGDFNVDGKPDLAVASYANKNVSVRLNSGNAVFGTAANYNAGSTPLLSMAVGDFNADAKPDIAVTNTADNLRVLLNNGAGTSFSLASGTTSCGGSDPRSMVVADFNADRMSDVATANYSSNNVSVMVGNGAGGFATGVVYSSGGTSPNGVTAGDFNGDAQTDLAVANGSGTVSVLIGNGAGVFAAAVAYGSGGTGPNSVTAGDFNNDGAFDLAVANGSGNSLGVLLQTWQHAGVCELTSPHAVSFSIQTGSLGAGQLVEATGQALDGAGRLEVAGQAYSPNAVDYSLVDGGRTLLTPSVTIAGLSVSREITVPATGNEDFARTVDVFSNPTASPITTTVRIVGNLGSDAATTVWGTSDGDSVVEATDQWIGTDDADRSGTPAIVHYLHGAVGLSPTAIAVTGDNIEWTYNLTVPAGRTVRLAHLTIVADTREAAQAAADTLVESDHFGGQAGVFLSTNEILSIANFQRTPPTVTLSVSNSPMAEAAGSATVVATLSWATPTAVTVNLAFSGTASLTADYTRSGTSITIPAGSTSGSILLTAVQDAVVELDETIVVDIDSVTGGTESAAQQVTATITNDDSAVVSISGFGGAEGDGGTWDGPFAINLTHPVDTPVTVRFSTADGTAVAPADYTSQSNVLVTIPAMSTYVSVYVTVIRDTTVELDETFTGTLSGLTNGGRNVSLSATPSGTATIANDDSAVVSIADGSLLEGNSGAANLPFTVSLTNPVDTAITVQFSTTDASAMAPGDYTAQSGALITIPALSTSVFWNVSVKGDTLLELDEAFTGTLSTLNASGRSVTLSSTPSATGTIIDDDSPVDLVSLAVSGIAGGNANSDTPSVSADGRYVAFASSASDLVAGDTNGVSDIFVRDMLLGTITRVSTNSSGAQVNNASTSPSISIDGRYVAFASFASNLVNDDYNGKQDIFVKDLVTGATVRPSRSSAGAEVNGDSYSPSVSADGSYVAFRSYATNLVSGDDNGNVDIFVRNRINGTTTRVSVDTLEQQSNGDSTTPSISADGRYVAFRSSASNLIPGDTNGSDDIFVRDTTLGTTTLVSTSTSGTQANATAETPSISADGRYVAFTSPAYNLVEGDNNGAWDVFVKDLNAGTLTRVSTTSSGAQATGGSSESPGISADGRYLTFSSQATNLVSGDGNGVSDIFVKDLLLGTTTRLSMGTSGAEGNAASDSPALSSGGRYVVFRSAATNLHPQDTTSTTDIFRVATPTVVADVASSTPNGTYTTGAAIAITVTFTHPVTISGVPTLTLETGSTDRVASYSGGSGTATLTFSYTVQPGDASSDLDYVGTASLALNGGTITDDAGNAATLGLPAPGAARSLSANKALVIDTPPLVTLSVTGNSVAEDQSAQSATVIATLSRPYSMPVTVDLAFSGTAELSTDYNRSGTSITIPAGDTTGSMSIAAVQDTLVELDETVVVDITTVANGMEVGTQQVTVTIANDDSAVVSISGGSVVEGNSGSTNLPFTVSLSKPVDTDVTLQFSTADGTAMAPGDYTAQSVVVVTIPALSTSVTRNVVVAGDTTVELDETVTGTISGLSHGGRSVSLSATPSASATITNDDSTVVSISGTTYTEGDSGTKNLPFFVLLTNPVDTAMTVQFSTADGTAVAPGDYVAQSQVTVTIPAGSTFVIPVTDGIRGDTTVEAFEFLTGSISNLNSAGRNVTLGTASVSGWIDNDDSAVVSIVGGAVAEGDSGTVNRAFTIALNKPVDTAVTVLFSTANGTAAAPADYTSQSDVLITIPAMSTSVTTDVAVRGDTTVELDETFTGTLSGLTNGGRNVSLSATTWANATITNDDSSVVSISGGSAVEGDSGTTSLRFTVSLTNPVDTGVAVGFATANGLAVAPADYTEQHGGLHLGALSAGGTLTISILGDTVPELDEAFSMTISSLTAGGRAVSLGTSSALGIIIDDDSPVDLVSLAVSGTTGGNANSESPSVSADGRYVAFASAASDLVAGDTNAVSDIFVRDMLMGTITRVSTSTSGQQANGASYAPSISANGDFVAFQSYATNLAEDHNALADIFLRNRITNATTLISWNSSEQPGNNDSYSPSISANGMYVAYRSSATNLASDDQNGCDDIFVRDRYNGTTARVSLSTTGTEADALSDSPKISTDGRYVVFASSATHLVSGDDNGNRDIFVRDLNTGSLTRVSTTSSGAQATGGDSNSPSISFDGRYVAFSSQATDLVSGDGNGVSDIFVKDLLLGTTTRVSTTNSGAQATGGSSEDPTISADSRYVAFSSQATNLVSGDGNGVSDIFVKDLLLGTTTRLSMGTSGAEGNAASETPAISADGRYVVFRSAATNLHPQDTTSTTDIFRVATPTVVADVASSTADGTYTTGAAIAITVTFTHPVTVSGVPTLTLETGTTDRVASYSGGSGTATLSFTYTVQAGDFSSDLDYLGTASLVLSSGKITDDAGNAATLILPAPGAARSLSANRALVIDAVSPTVTVDILDTSLDDQDRSSVVEITFSEVTAAFAIGDLTAVGGTLSDFIGSETAYRVTFTADDDTTTTGLVTVTAGSYTDAVGNLGAAGSDTASIDTRNPTVTVDIVDASLSDPDNSSVVTFTFSEATDDFVIGDLTAAGGTLSGFSGSETSYSVTFTADDDAATSGSVTVNEGSYTDAAGNLGTAGSDSVSIDTQNPTVTVNIVDTSLSDTDNSSVVTFTFSEATADFAIEGLVAVGGTLSDFSGSGSSYSVTFRANDDTTAAGSVSVAAGSYTDAAGNAGTAGTDSVTVDTRNPTVTVNLVDASLNDADNSSVVNITFSEATANFAIGDLVAVGGTLSGFSGSGTSYSVTFTADDDVTTTGSVSVTAGSYTDAAGNVGEAGTDTVVIDTRNPTVTADIVDTSLSDTDNSSVVTFTFSEATTTFTIEDLTVVGGTLSDFSGSGSSYSVTFTVNDGVTTTGSVSVNASSYTDAAGNLGATGSDSVSIDTQNPTVTVNIVDTSLSDTDNSSVVTFTFSEATADFAIGDLTAVGGTLSDFSGSGSSYSVTFTADDGVATTGSVAVTAGSYTDAAGNAGAAGTDTVSIDTQNPTVTVDIVDTSLSDTNNSSVVNITFSEATVDFAIGDLAAVGGTLSNFSGSGSSYSVTFTADDDAARTGSVTITAGSYTDAAGNPGATGTDTVSIDTRNPTVTVDIVDDSLSDADNTSVVNITFSEATDDFAIEDLTAAGGTLSGFSGSETSYSVTFTADDDTATTGSVTVTAGSYTDAAGNAGAAGTETVSIDTQNPTVTVDIVDGSLSDADNSSVVTFTFSEATADFAIGDLTAVGGTLSDFSGSGSSYSVTFTADDGVATTGSVAVTAGSYTDAAGNAGAAGTDTVPIDTQNPTVTVDIVDTSLSDTNNSSVVNITFSEATVDFAIGDLAAVGGTLSNFSGSGSSYSVTFTADDDAARTGSVTATAGSYTDAVGNLGATGMDTVSIDTRNPTMIVDIVDDSLSDADNTSVVNITFSEATDDFAIEDLTAAGGTLSGFSGSETSYSVTFTADDDTATTGSVTVTAGSYTDAAGNLGAAGTDTASIDTRNPTVTVDIVDASLNDADNSSVVTITFSEATDDFAIEDLTAEGGTLSTFSGSGTNYSVTFTADDDTVTVNAGSYTNAAGNLGATGTDMVLIDTRNATVTVDIVDASLNDTDNTSVVNITFSEATDDFAIGDLTAVGGTLSDFSGSETAYSVTFTADDDTATVGSVTVTAGSYTDAVGNLGAAGSDSVSIDTLNPTVTVDIVASVLDRTDNSSAVSIAFSEPVAGFSVDDLIVVGGTLADFSGTGTSYTATFTGALDVQTTGTIEVKAGSYIDAAGNSGVAGADSVTIDTELPGVTIDLISAVEPTLAGDDSSQWGGDADSLPPSTSSNGRYVAFMSEAGNLVIGDTNGVADIFVRDVVNGTTTRVSTDGLGVQANGASETPSISADGRYVVFRSFASNLVSGDVNGVYDIFVKDRISGATTRLSTNSFGVQALGESSQPSISADGRYVAFRSSAANLVSDDTNGRADIFVKDRISGTTDRVSASSLDAQANGASESPSISADGRYVAFRSFASNLVVGDSNAVADIFVKDRTGGATTRVSTSGLNGQVTGESSSPSISADGRYVAFRSSAGDLVNGDTNGKADIFVKDLIGGTTTRVSTDGWGMQAEGWSYAPSISADGRYVAFYSSAGNLVSGDTNGAWDVFVKDLVSGATTRVSSNGLGVEANADSDAPSISADGKYVSFRSFATNLHPYDTTSTGDIDRMAVSFAAAPTIRVNLLSGNGSDDITIRRNGNDVEVYDNVAETVLAAQSLDTLRSISVLGAAVENDRVKVDFGFGGFFALPDGIHFDGGAGGLDALEVHGDGNTVGRYDSPGAWGAATLNISSGAATTAIDFTGIEPLSIGGFQAMAFHMEGSLDIGSETLALDVGSITGLDLATTLSGGTITSPGGLALGDGESLAGYGAVASPLTALGGSTILATGDLSLGDSAQYSGFFSDGSMTVGPHTVTILDANEAVLGSLTVLGDAGNDGTLDATKGILLEQGKSLQGRGTVRTTNGQFKNNGFVVAAAGSGITFQNLVTGIGDFDGPITFSGGYSPGQSPAQIDFLGDAIFTASNTLTIELGGRSAGDEYDRLDVAGEARLSGTLDVELTDDFVPAAGDRFEILESDSELDGTFSAVNLPSLPTGLEWSMVYETNTLALVVKPRGESNVVARHLFYNASAWDGNNAAANDADYAAIAPGPSRSGHGHVFGQNELSKELGKQALLPGQTATFANYSSYTKGINGIMIALDNLANPGGLSAADFIFRVSRGGATTAWTPAPAPRSIRVAENVIDSHFSGQPDVVTLIWADENPYTRTREAGAISNQWLQVTVLATAATGLAGQDVFYFGNQIGESGNSATDTNVDQNDEIGARNHPHSAFNPALASDPYDFNRDGKVDQNDEILARNNPASAFTRISLLSAGLALTAEGTDQPISARASTAQVLTAEALGPIVVEARLRWEATGLDGLHRAALAEAVFAIDDLDRGTLGLATPASNAIVLDDDAAGFGWFVDPTPRHDEEFVEGIAPSGSPAEERMDLLTAVMHEMGHLLGKSDVDASQWGDDLMADQLSTGVRRPKPLAARDALFAAWDE